MKTQMQNCRQQKFNDKDPSIEILMTFVGNKLSLVSTDAKNKIIYGSF